LVDYFCNGAILRTWGNILRLGILDGNVFQTIVYSKRGGQQWPPHFIILITVIYQWYIDSVGYLEDYRLDGCLIRYWCDSSVVWSYFSFC